MTRVLVLDRGANTFGWLNMRINYTKLRLHIQMCVFQYRGRVGKVEQGTESVQKPGRVYHTLLGDGLEHEQESGEETHMIRRVSALRSMIMDAATEDHTGPVLQMGW